LETTARRDGDSWVLDGRKKWIGNGTIADVIVVWARDTMQTLIGGREITGTSAFAP
jgi:glutaryl-CoA dehydrogenase